MICVTCVTCTALAASHPAFGCCSLTQIPSSLIPQAKLSTLHPGLFPAFNLASAHGPPVSIPPPVAAAAAAAEEPTAAATASHPDGSNSPHTSRPAGLPHPTPVPADAAADASPAAVSAQSTEQPAGGTANGGSPTGAPATSAATTTTTTTAPPVTTNPPAAAAAPKPAATPPPSSLTPEAVQALLSPATSLLRYHLMPQPKQGPDSGEAGGRVCSSQVAELFRTEWSEEMGRLAHALQAEAEAGAERQAGTGRFSR